MNIGQKIKQRRIELGMSQRDLAAKMGYNHSTITRIETGKIDPPQSKVVKFAEVMNTSIAYLMDWEEVQKNNDAITDIILRLRNDNEFLSVVESLMPLDAERLSIIKDTASAFLK